MPQQKNIVAGIDLGTTYSAIAYVDHTGQAHIIPNSTGERITPSVVAIGERSGEVLVGQEAKDQAVLYPERVIALIKREMGKKPEEVREGNSYSFWKRRLSPEEISSFILKQLKRDAEKHLGHEMKEAVITVPAYFGEGERGATIRAGEMAGFKVKRIINEPTAAALYYGVHKANQEGTAFVFDLGGGTFDVTVLKISGEEMHVVGTNGDHRLGGADWDARLVDHVAECFQIEHGLDPREDAETAAALCERAEKAKRRLSDLPGVQIIGESGGHKLKVDISREKFEDLTSDLVARCADLCALVLEECRLSWPQIDTLLLAGGSTRMPMIRALLRQISGTEIHADLVNPDECVALGAALQGAMLQTQGSLLPAAPKRSAGLSIAALVDVTAHSLGMITLKGKNLKNSIIIPKNSAIPCEKSRDDFATSSDQQKTLEVHLVQGEAGNPHHANLLESYEFYDLPKRPRGQTRLRVTFKYNANGVVEVQAEDFATRKVLPFRKKARPNLEELEKGSSQPLDVALTLDCSGSMSGAPLADAKNAALQFLDRLGLESNRVAVVRFDSDARLVCGLTSQQAKLRESIQALNTAGSTNMTEAIQVAQQELHTHGERARVMVILTDGHPDSAGSALENGRRAKSAGIRIITIGVGQNADRNFLRQLASAPEDYHFVNESIELEEAFVNIATELAAGGAIKM